MRQWRAMPARSGSSDAMPGPSRHSAGRKARQLGQKLLLRLSPLNSVTWKSPVDSVAHREAVAAPPPGHRDQVVVGAGFQGLLADDGPGRHHPHDAPLHQAFGLFRILQLLADGHLEPVGHQGGDVASAEWYGTPHMGMRPREPASREVKTMSRTRLAVSASSPNIS